MAFGGESITLRMVIGGLAIVSAMYLVERRNAAPRRVTEPGRKRGVRRVSSTIVIILIVIAVLVLALIAFLIIRRQRYVRALRGRGWTFESRPAWSGCSITTLRLRPRLRAQGGRGYLRPDT